MMPLAGGYTGAQLRNTVSAASKSRKRDVRSGGASTAELALEMGIREGGDVEAKVCGPDGESTQTADSLRTG